MRWRWKSSTNRPKALKAGGADVLWVETMSAPEEYRAAAEAALRAGMPWCGTMSFDTAGRTMMGVTSAAMAEMVEKLPNPPIAFGANCGVGASDLMRTVLGFVATGTERPLIAKGNAGIPKYHDGHIHYDGTPELMAEYAVLARDAGVRIIGGCCGTMPEHLRAMRAALESRPKGPARRWRISRRSWAGSPRPRTAPAMMPAAEAGTARPAGLKPEFSGAKSLRKDFRTISCLRNRFAAA
jgi:hypothetical protein